MANPATFKWPADWEEALPLAERKAIDACRRIGLKGQDADEVIQLVAIALWEASRRTNPPLKFESLDRVGAWLYRVAWRAALGQRKCQAAFGHMEIVDLGMLPVSNQSSGLTEYLSMLTDERHRDIILLYYEENCGFAEIAVKRGISVTTAFNLLWGAIEVLRTKLDDD